MSSSVKCSNLDCKSDPNVKLLVCSSCNQAFYCSQSCQKSHWPTHKSFCKNVKKQSNDFFKRMSTSGLSQHLDEEEKNQIRIKAIFAENSNPGAIEKAADELGEHPLVIGGGMIVVTRDGSQEFTKGDVAAIYATKGIVWDGTPRFGLGYMKVDPKKFDNKMQEKDLTGGQKLITCEHGNEFCDVCCVDHTMLNNMARLESRNQLAKEARSEVKRERRKGCANPECRDSGVKKLPAVCTGCKVVAYCGSDCQTSHYSEHKVICKSQTPKFRGRDGKENLKSYPRGAKLEHLFEGEPTGLVCRVIDFSTEGPVPTYFLVDLELAEPFKLNCADAGPLDWIDERHKVHRSLPEQSWKIWFMENAPTYPILSLEGLGPFHTSQIFQKYIKQKPIDVFCQVISCDAPSGQNDLKISQLKNYNYTVRTCYKCQVFHGNDSVFEIECEDVHRSGKWRIAF